MPTEPEPTTPTEPEVKPILKANIKDWDGDELCVWKDYGDILLITQSVALRFSPKDAPHTVAALKAVMPAIEMDGGEVVR